MWGLFHNPVNQCFKCQDPEQYHTVEFDRDYDPNVPATLLPDGTVKRGDGVVFVTVDKRLVSEADDTDSLFNATARTKESDAESELSSAWAQAAQLRNMDTPLPDIGPAQASRQPLTPQPHKQDHEVFTPQRPQRAEDFIGARTPSQPPQGDSLGSNNNLQHIQEELDRTRELLGLPSKRPSRADLEDDSFLLPSAQNGLPTLDLPRATPVMQERAVEAPNLNSLVTTSASSPSAVPAGADGVVDDPMSTQEAATAPAEQALSREEQKKKIMEEVAALRESVRKKKFAMVAEQSARSADNPSSGPDRGASIESEAAPLASAPLIAAEGAAPTDSVAEKKRIGSTDV